MSAPVGKIEMVGDWKKQMNVSLGWALNTTYEIGGRSLAQACKHALILMAQSAAKLTKQARKNRTIQRDENKRPYLAKYEKDGSITRWYLPNRKQNPDEYASMMEKLRPIANQGLAKRSWLWGLKAVVGSQWRIRGVTTVRKLLTETVGGFILTNRLNYLPKILPPGWLEIVKRAAVDKVMKQAQIRLKNQWESAMKRFGVQGAMARKPDLAKYFLRETP